uniref:Protein kinase domain-containing protein n=2 Tax=Ascaris lumbricoides TaxID=6252 RepID=A0A0M3IS18_ASCLU
MKIFSDLACRNCLISKHGEIKITDFGLSKLVDEITARTKILQPRDHLPVRWMAPETLTRVPLYSTKSDVWSYGMVCYEIFNNGEKPWPYLEAKIIAKSYKNGKIPNIPSATPPQIAKMMTRTWHLKAERRPNFGEIIVTLTKAHCAIPPPPPEMLSVFSLEGVTRRTPEEMVRHHQKSNLPDVKTLSIEDKVSTTTSSPPSPPENVTVKRTHTSHKRLPIRSELETLQSKSKLTRPRARTKPALKLRTTETNVSGTMFAKKYLQQLGNKRIRTKTVGHNRRLLTAPLPRRMNTALSRN